MDNIGLYYPFIHFRNEAWLKAAALYWPGMGRICPMGYPTNDSYTVRALSDELDFIVDVDPTSATLRVNSIFTKLLDDCGEELAYRLSVDRRSPSHHGPTHSDDSQLAFVYAPKIAQVLRERLQSLGLATTRGEMRSAHRSAPSGDEQMWVGMDERLASIYMCVLADELATAGGLQPTTDDARAQVAVGGWTAERMAAILLGFEFGATQSRAESSLELDSCIAFLAITTAIPQGIEDVPIERIIRFRQTHESELDAFRREVKDAAESLANLDTRVDPNVLQAHLHSVVSRRFEAPQRDLRKALRGANLDAVDTVLNLKIAVPALIAGVATDQNLATGIGAAVGIYGLSRLATRQRRNLRNKTPGATYLLNMQKQLAPKTSVRRSLRIAKAIA